MDEYLAELEAIGDAIDEKSRLHFDMNFVRTLGVDEDIFNELGN